MSLSGRFFPVSATSTLATTNSVAYALPVGPQSQVGPIIRVARETSSVRVFLSFTNGVTGNASDTSMELISGVVEEFENPNPAYYTHYSVITASGTCYVSISCGPRYS